MEEWKSSIPLPNSQAADKEEIISDNPFIPQ